QGEATGAGVVGLYRWKVKAKLSREEGSHGARRSLETRGAGGGRGGGGGRDRPGHRSAPGGGAAEGQARHGAVPADAQEQAAVRHLPALGAARPVQDGGGQDQPEGLVLPLRAEAQMKGAEAFGRAAQSGRERGLGLP